ncbi:MAG TPA: hypothetical protein VFE58_08955 [Tepidisphaeraceae bacterium]|jgi:hypothetical protein|nr:hypothetical protein [Tepidisphaeraceae bacterium]
MAQVNVNGVDLTAPDPLPIYDGSPDTASFVPGWVSVSESVLGRSLTDQEKVNLGVAALALYNYQSAASTTLGSTDTTITTSGQTIMGGQYSVTGDFLGNVEEVTGERFQQIGDAATSAAKWAGQVISAPIKGLLSGIFDTKTILIVGGVAVVGIGGLYMLTKAEKGLIP